MHSQLTPLPDWLRDEDSLRDEGVLFGLSDAPPDSKTAQIRTAFAQQSALPEKLIEQYTEQIGELDRRIKQHESRLIALRDQIAELQNRQPVAHNLLRTVVSLGLSVVMSIGTFYLIDETLRPSFPNRWIAVGVFLAGMFNLFGRTSFFYETGTRLSGRRIIEEIGLPLAASLFVLVHALQTQPVSLATGLFGFVFFIFLLSGKLVLSTLTSLQHDLTAIQENRQMRMNKESSLLIWMSEIERLERAVDVIRAQKKPIASVLTQTEAVLTQVNAQRDWLINLFLGEFELARSLRERLTEQQREAISTRY